MGKRFYTLKKPEVVIFVRHAATCPHSSLEAYPRCQCVKWLRWTAHGRQHKVTAGTRVWSVAEEKRAEQQKTLDAGKSLKPDLPSNEVTLAKAVSNFLQSKEDVHVQEVTLRKLRAQLGLFEQFMTTRGKLFAREVTPQDVLDFRSTWRWSDLTKIKAQQNLRGFVRFACDGNRSKILDALGTIKETKEGRRNRQPKPFTKDELATMLRHTKRPRTKTLIKLMVSQGLAGIDCVQLERRAVEVAAKTGILEVERQKTGKTQRAKIDPTLCTELMAVLNGNPRYVFWHGENIPDSEVKLLRKEIREVMTAAGVYQKGDVLHRFRDTAVDIWASLGWSTDDMARGLGDTVAIFEKHYKAWASQRETERLKGLPTMTW
jgi:integrase